MHQLVVDAQDVPACFSAGLAVNPEGSGVCWVHQRALTVGPALQPQTRTRTNLTKYLSSFQHFHNTCPVATFALKAECLESRQVSSAFPTCRLSLMFGSRRRSRQGGKGGAAPPGLGEAIVGSRRNKSR